ncbi:F0F1 ATP synthase subunit B [bacterium]|nr:F0F1 ATP synthase subunit B [bacterium]
MSSMSLLRKYLAVAVVGALLIPVLSLPVLAAAEHGEAGAAEVEHGTEAAHEGESAGGDHGHHEEGVPLSWKTDLVLWSLVTFVLFLIVLKKAAWGPLIAGLDKRESKYRKLLDDARADRDKAMSLLAAHEKKLAEAQKEVTEIIAEARRDAERTKADIVATAQKEAESTRQRALDDIDRARDQAVSALFEHMRANVVIATEKVLARALTDDDRSRLVDEALAEVSSN